MRQHTFEGRKLQRDIEEARQMDLEANGDAEHLLARARARLSAATAQKLLLESRLLPPALKSMTKLEWCQPSLRKHAQAVAGANQKSMV